MCGKQENIGDACLFACAKQSFRALLRRTEQSEGIRDPAGLLLWDAGGIVRWINLVTRLPQPMEIGRTWIGEERLTGRKPTAHPLRPHARIGTKPEGHDKHNPEPRQGTAGTRCPSLQMLPGGTD